MTEQDTTDAAIEGAIRAAHRFIGASMIGPVYIAGPMTGLPELNYPAFNAAAEVLRGEGHRVENPAENERPNNNPTWADWMRLGLAQMLLCDAVLLLPGWQQSPGARIEARTAIDLGLAVIDGELGLTMRSMDHTVRDAEMGELIAQRDRAEDWADQLAQSIASHTGIDVGEHSNGNNPWANAVNDIRSLNSWQANGQSENEHLRAEQS